jgi:hypothetical protein
VLWSSTESTRVAIPLQINVCREERKLDESSQTTPRIQCLSLLIHLTTYHELRISAVFECPSKCGC